MLLDPFLSAYIRRLNQHYLGFGDEDGAIELPAPDAERTYLLYLHVPFCEVLCPFCSFHRVEFQAPRATRYLAALRQEIDKVSAAGYRFHEVYVGGGTPTVLPVELAEMIAWLRSGHPVRQVSVETNPDHLEGHHLEVLRQAGVDRLSVGVQSFDDELLQEMGRLEKYGSGATIRRRLEHVRGVFPTLNVDMIFNFPHQTPALLKKDLEILTTDLDVDQVSFYPLMVASSTRRYVGREMGSIDYRAERGLYRQIVAHMLAAGYARSSAWCFSRSAAMIDEYIIENEEYLGLGSGSFSYVDGSLYASTFSINNYLQLVGTGCTGVVRRRVMSQRDQMRYYLLMRLFGGTLDLALAETRFAGRFHRSLWLDLIGLRLLGAVRQSPGRLDLTESGFYLWVMMMREFFTGVNDFRDEMRRHIPEERKVLTD